MLIEFSVMNYRSIAEEQILNLVPAAKQREYSNNIFLEASHKSLNVIGLYGANASGKSNLLLAMSLMNRIISLSAQTASTTKLPYDPFLLKEGWEEKPTYFEVVFVSEKIRYRYGFEYNQERITGEWLYRKAKGREVVLFEREGDIIEVSLGLKSNAKIIDTAIEATRHNALFLSVCDMFNIKVAKKVFQWFTHFQMVNGLNPETINTLLLWKSPIFQPKIKQFLGRLDLDFTKIEVEAKEVNRNLLEMNIKTVHQRYNEKGEFSGKEITWQFEDKESTGTKQAFHLSGPIVATLEHGGVLIIDEIEAKLHPLITVDIINLFLNPTTNPNKAQLIFATHDTNLLSYTKLRRDQIYFTEKNKWEATELFSLSDFVYLKKNRTLKERPDANKEKRYLEGRYGAIPMLEKLETLKILTNGKTR